MKTSYLDHAASTPVLEQSKNAFLNACELFANPSSAHTFGNHVSQKIQAHRERFFYFLSAKKSYDYIFTSSATESNHMAILGHDWREGDEVVYSDVCHPSQIKPVELLESRFGVKLCPIKLDNGCITVQSVTSLITDKTKLIVLHHVNGQTGQIVPIDKISDAIRSKSRCHIHIDAVQSFAKLPLTLEDEQYDSVTISSHKIGGVKGVAGLYLKKYSLLPLFVGGDQEFGLRSSTESLPLIASFVAAANYRFENRGASFREVSRIYDYAKSKVKDVNALFPFSGNISPYILSFIYPKHKASKLIEDLGREGICFSSTSACSSKKSVELEIFKRLGVREQYKEYVLRLSFSPETTVDNIDEFIARLSS